MRKLCICIVSISLLVGCGSPAYKHDKPKDAESVKSPSSTPSTTNGVQTNNNTIPSQGKELYAKCAGCHGKNGEKHALGKSNIIAGQNTKVTVTQLEDYKAGRLNQYGMGQLMKGQVTGLSSDDILEVSRYIETLSGYRP